MSTKITTDFMHSTAVHAIFLMQGVQRITSAATTPLHKPFAEAIEANFGGEIEVAQHIAQLAASVASSEAKFSVGKDYSGVLEYEVTSNLGEYWAMNSTMSPLEFSMKADYCVAMWFKWFKDELFALSPTEFTDAYKSYQAGTGSGYTDEDIAFSYRQYLFDPTGHFIGKVQS